MHVTTTAPCFQHACAHHAGLLPLGSNRGSARASPQQWARGVTLSPNTANEASQTCLQALAALRDTQVFVHSGIAIGVMPFPRGV